MDSCARDRQHASLSAVVVEKMKQRYLEHPLAERLHFFAMNATEVSSVRRLTVSRGAWMLRSLSSLLTNSI